MRPGPAVPAETLETGRSHVAKLASEVEGEGRQAPSIDTRDERTPMKAVTYHGKRDVRVDTVPDPTIQEPTDAIIRVTSSGLCGSDLHLYELFGPFIDVGDILGHEPMGVVEAVGEEVSNIKVGDRVVIPFNISCGTCWMCKAGLQSQCETTQVHDHGTGAALLGYTKLYGQVAGGQAELLRVPQAQYGPIVVPEGLPDERFLFLSDVLPTAWQAVEYAQIPEGGSVAVLGLGPIGQMSVRIASHRGAAQVFGIDLVPNGSRWPAATESRCSTSRSTRHRRGVAGTHEGSRTRLRHRRGRHGSTWLGRRQGGAGIRRAAARCRRVEDDGEGRRRSTRGAPGRDRHRPPRGNIVDRRGLRRDDRSASDAADVR